MKGNNAKATSICAKAIKALLKPQEFKSKVPKRSSHRLSQLAYIVHSRLGTVLMPALSWVSGCGGQRPRPRLKPRLKPRPRLRLWLWLML